MNTTTAIFNVIQQLDEYDIDYTIIEKDEIQISGDEKQLIIELYGCSKEYLEDGTIRIIDR